jgi:LysM repeat protein
MNKILRIATSLIILLIILNGCKTSKKTGGIKVDEMAYVDPYLGKMESELSVSEMYIKTYRDLAIDEMKRTKIPASITLAQGILESGNGNSYLAKKANNHFGIKCGGSWKGEAIYFDDDEANECFRKYSNPRESYIDHSDFLVNGQRYESLFALDITDYKSWATGLKAAGYATRRNYAELLINLIEKHNLTIYDVAIPKQKASKVVHETDDQFKYNGVTAILAKENDTYNEIAKRNGISVSKLLEYNDLKEPRSLKTGEVVYFGPKKTVAKESYHIVKAEDRMYTIAQEYGIKLSALYQKNLLKEGEEPAVGEILYLRQKRSEPAETRVIEEGAIAEDVPEKKEETPVENVESKVEEPVAKEEPKEAEPAKEGKNPKVVFEDEGFEEVPIADEKTPQPVEVEKPVEEPVEKTVEAPKRIEEGETVTMHQVEAGETLYSLSRKYGVSVDDLKEWNNLSSNELSVNDKLIVSKSAEPEKKYSGSIKEEKKSEDIGYTGSPGKSSATAGGSDTIFHIVKEGESFYTISRQYELTIIDLIALNDLKEYKIKKGQKLIVKLPDHAKATESGSSGSSGGDDMDFFIKKDQPKADAPKTKEKTGNETATGGVIHQVQAGETLYSISRKYGISVDEIKRLNGLTSNVLNIGQKLKVGGEAATSVQPEKKEEVASDSYHIVQKGETLYSISRKYSLTVEKLKELNGLSSNNLSLGQKLRVK